MPEKPKRYKPASSGAPKYTPPGMVRPSAHRRGYTSAWQKASASFLASHPLCVHCQQRGVTEGAAVVDHITPHKGDKTLFWESGNWMALCAACHNRKTATVDGGFGREVKPGA